MIQEHRTVASAQPKESGVVPEPAGSDAARGLDGLLLEVSRAAARHRDLQSLLCELVTLLQRAAPFDLLAVLLHDPARDVMRLHTIVTAQPLVRTVMEMPTSETPAGVVWQTQQPLLVPNVDHETRFPESIEG
jgi:formate hydrogenlyase transcriptional activator